MANSDSVTDKIRPSEAWPLKMDDRGKRGARGG